MAIITSIKPQKNQKRVNVYLDGKFSTKGGPASGWGFGIDLDNFVKLNLKIGQELTDKEIEKIIKKAEFQKTLDKLLRFATLRPHSEREIRDWLKRKKVHESLHKDLFDRLNRLDLIDDTKFARWWVEQRIEFKSKSKKELNHELRIKGIKKEIIEDVWLDTEIDEEKVARELLEKKIYRWKNLDTQEAKQKIVEFLARKGFDWETIDKVVAKVVKSVVE